MKRRWVVTALIVVAATAVFWRKVVLQILEDGELIESDWDGLVPASQY